MSVRGADLLVVGCEGAALTPRERTVLRGLRPAGMILFQRNVASAEQLAGLVSELRSLVPGLLLFVDAEGGRVDRLREIVGRAPAAASLAGVPPAVARRAGKAVGAALRHFGFDVDFAPVVDLDRGERDNALDGRTLGTTPRAVTARGRQFLRGLHAAGTGGCVKHFPGLGAARMDTHRDGAPIQLSARELARDLAPFAALGREAGMLMVSHATYPALDPSGRPATLSATIATGLVRRRLRFRGVVVSDDLEMGALGAWGDLPERAAAALAAGCDLLPICRDLEACRDVAAKLGSVRLRARREEAARRLATCRRALARLRRTAAPPAASLARIQQALAAARAAAGEP